MLNVRRRALFSLSLMASYAATAAPTRASRTTLLVGTKRDPASVNIVNALLSHSPAVLLPFGEEGQGLFRSESGKVVLWHQEESLLKLDDVHETVGRIMGGGTFDEILFLSRHTAASGTASLTVHPIGVPWLSEPCPKSGGIPGRCSPPHQDIASIFRKLVRLSKSRGLDKRFQLTMEATHHGPFASIPTAFVEIGSTEEHWPDAVAGEVWRDVLIEYLRLAPDAVGSLAEEEEVAEADKVALVIIGGSHYVPKANDWAKLSNRAVTGHSLASYAINPLIEAGTFAAAVDECLASTRVTHSCSELIVLVDLKGEAKDKVLNHLADKHSGVKTFSDFKSIKNFFK